MPSTTVCATFTATVCYHYVDDGGHVDQGDPVMAVEAMKMQHDITAPETGTVRFKAQLGEVVEQDQPIFDIETE